MNVAQTTITLPGLVPAALAIGAVLTALGLVWKLLDKPRSLGRKAAEFFEDWGGTPARPGREAVPSFPERMASMEARQRDQAHYVRGELTARVDIVRHSLEQLEARGTANATELAELRRDVTALGVRVSDHRARNDQQIDLLREAVARVEARGHNLRQADHQTGRDGTS